MSPRLIRVLRRSAPMLSLAAVCYAASFAFDFDTHSLLVGLAVVFGLLGVTTAAFTWFDRSST